MITLYNLQFIKPVGWMGADSRRSQQSLWVPNVFYENPIK